MIQVIESGAIEAPNNIHHILDQHRLMESSRLGHLAISLNLVPSSLFYIILEQVIKSLLGCVNAPKNNDLVFIRNCAVSIPWLGPCSFDPTNLKPQI
jgi:hypothetical protein